MNKTAKRVLAPIVLMAGVSSAALMGTTPAHANSGGFGFVVVNGPLAHCTPARALRHSRFPVSNTSTACSAVGSYVAALGVAN